MGSWAEVLGDGPIRGKEPLGMPCRLEALHPPLPLTRRVVRVLRTVVELAMLAMLYARQELTFGRSITFELIGDEHPGHILVPFEQCAEEPLSRRFVPAPSHQNIQHIPILIHRSQQIVASLVEAEQHLIQMPLVARTGTWRN
jgi:hypothetical protein